MSKTWKMSTQFSHRATLWTLVGSLSAAALVVGCSDDDGDDTESVTERVMPGAAGAGMGMTAEAPTGVIEILIEDISLTSPTTVALRGAQVFAPLAQFDDLFPADGAVAMPDPFQAVSVPLAGGALGASIALPEEFYPEGITAAADGTLYIGSLTTGGIQQVPPGSTTAEVLVAGGTVAERGVVGLTVDNERNIVWFCDSSPAAMTPAGAVVGVSTADGSEMARHNLPNAGVDGRAAFCNDLIVTNDGNVLVTDSWSGRIYMIAAADVMTADSAMLWSEAPELAPADPVAGFGVNGLEMVGDMLVFANGGLFVMDPAAPTSAMAITLSGADPLFLGGPDGLALVAGTTDLVVADNGGRIIKVTLDL